MRCHCATLCKALLTQPSFQAYLFVIRHAWLPAIAHREGAMAAEQWQRGQFQQVTAISQQQVGEIAAAAASTAGKISAYMVSMLIY